MSNCVRAHNATQVFVCLTLPTVAMCDTENILTCGAKRVVHVQCNNELNIKTVANGLLCLKPHTYNHVTNFSPF